MSATYTHDETAGGLPAPCRFLCAVSGGGFALYVRIQTLSDQIRCGIHHNGKLFTDQFFCQLEILGIRLPQLFLLPGNFSLPDMDFFD